MRSFDDRLAAAVIAGLVAGTVSGLEPQAHEQLMENTRWAVRQARDVGDDLSEGYRQLRRDVERTRDVMARARRGYRDVSDALGS